MLSIVIDLYFQVFEHDIFLSNPALNDGFIVFIGDTLSVAAYFLDQLSLKCLLLLKFQVTTRYFGVERLYIFEIFNELHPLLIFNVF